MKSIVVYCGSGTGIDPSFMELAYQTGVFLAKNNITVVYGGAKIGLMGAVADGALAFQGKVIGVLPEFMSGNEIAHENLSELIMVKTMHERKLIMHQLSDAVIALPGGFGTMEELFEMLTWAQLGLHQKPTGILNYNNYYDALLMLSNSMRDHGFLKPEYRNMLLDATNLESLFEKMNEYKAVSLQMTLTIQNT